MSKYDNMDVEELRRKAWLYDTLRSATPSEFVALWDASIHLECSYDQLVEQLAKKQGHICRT